MRLVTIVSPARGGIPGARIAGAVVDQSTAVVGIPAQMCRRRVPLVWFQVLCWNLFLPVLRGAIDGLAGSNRVSESGPTLVAPDGFPGLQIRRRWESRARHIRRPRCRRFLCRGPPAEHCHCCPSGDRHSGGPYHLARLSVQRVDVRVECGDDNLSVGYATPLFTRSQQATEGREFILLRCDFQATAPRVHGDGVDELG